MALRSLLTAAERGHILRIPTDSEELAARYTLSDADMSLVRQRRGEANRLGFAVQLCLLRYPGMRLPEDAKPPTEMVSWLASHLAVSSEAWGEYGTREETRQEHGREIRTYLGMSAFGITDFRGLLDQVSEVAAQTDKGLVLVESARDFLQTKKVALPGVGILERACAQALNWGDETTSSSDGQRFRAGSKAEPIGHVNPKYGAEPGRLVYTHVSDQYSPFHSKLINVGARDATYVRDGLLYHESELQIQEHYTDTAGFTDHLFALMDLLGYRFAPRIRNIGDTRFLSPRGWEHINLTGDYTWPRPNHIKPGKYRPLRRSAKP